MSRSPFKIAIGVVGAGAALIAAVVGGLFIYVNATAVPIHPDPAQVPSAMPAAPPAAWTAAAANARAEVRAAVTHQNLPGLSVAVGAAGDIVWAEGFGYADLEKKTPVTPQTRFRIGDVSMPLTSAAVGWLVERQRLNLDHDIQEYVPEFPQKAWAVTLRQLMAHTAGLRDDAGDEESIAQRCGRTVDVLQRFADRPLLFEPDTRFRRSSYGWILVSAAIEAAAQMPFFAFMRAELFDRLHMTATVPDQRSDAIPDRATFYFPRFGGDTRYGPELTREGDYSCFAGAYGFLSTAPDLARFALALEGGTLLQRATVETLQGPHRLASGDETGQGLGWRLDRVALAGELSRTAGHDTRPDFLGGSTSLLTFPDRGLVVVVTTNTSFADTRSIALGVAQAFAQH